MSSIPAPQASLPLDSLKKLGDRAAGITARYGVFVALAVVVAFMSVKINGFFAWSTFMTIGLSGVEAGVLAAAFTVAMIAGRIDLAVGTLVGFLASIFGVLSLRGHLPIWAGALVIVGVALAVALVHGFLTVNIGINAVIVTFATSQVLFGVGQWIQTRHAATATGYVIPIPPSSWPFRLITWTSTRWWSIPIPVWLMLGIYAALYVVMSHTRLGAHIYAVGANPDAAERAGIRVRMIWRLVFVLTAGASLLMVFFYLGRQGSVTVGHGYGMEFDVLTAVLLGGASFAGGVGRVERTLVAVLLLYTLNFGMQTLQVDPNVTRMTKGGILLAAVALSGYVAKRRA